MEKGGKGYSKPSLKTPTTTQALRGKDDTIKSKRGRKVQFQSEDSLDDDMLDASPKSGGKFGTPMAKGGLSKGSKGDGGGKGNGGAGKASASKEPPKKLELNIEQELPENAKCLMNCEAAQILGGIQEQMVMLSRDPSIKIPVSFDKGLQYSKTGELYTNPQSVRQILATLKKHGVSDGEISVIANTCPETVDVVFALVPSLKEKRSKLREPLSKVLSELNKLKLSSMN